MPLIPYFEVPVIHLGSLPIHGFGILVALGFIFFLIGMVRFFFSESEENREKGRQFALWGIIALVVLFSVWGIVNILVSTLK